MILLAIDSSTRALGIALYDGQQVRYELTWNSENFHTVELAPAIQEALKRAGLKMKAVEAVGVAIGPGSYTGLRIGLALAKGLTLNGQRALITVPTLDVVAAAQPIANKPLAAVLQAGRGRLAVAWYAAKDGRWVAQSEAELSTAQELLADINEPTIICGELYEEERKVLARKHANAQLVSPAWSNRRPAVLAELAWQRWQSGEVTDPVGLGPVYTRSAEKIPQ
jgi:tRNA threonylcarbamoyladenosine biosynthesis protein TsaB